MSQVKLITLSDNERKERMLTVQSQKDGFSILVFTKDKTTAIALRNQKLKKKKNDEEKPKNSIFMTTITTIFSQHSGQSCNVFGKVLGVRDDQKFLKMVTIRKKSNEKHFIITIFIIFNQKGRVA